MAETDDGNLCRKIVDFPGKAKSAVWNHFGFYLDEDGNPDKTNAICKVCRAMIKYTGNTTNLNSHLLNWHRRIMPNLSKLTGVISKVTPSAIKPVPVAVAEKYSGGNVMRPDTCYAIAYCMARDLRPMAIVSDPGFQQLVSCMDPRATIPVTQYFQDTTLPSMYLDIRQNIEKYICKALHVAIATDLWTAVNLESYVTFTTYFVSDNFQMHSYALRTCEVTGCTTTRQMMDVIEKFLEDWKIPKYKTIWVTNKDKYIDEALQEMGIPVLSCFGCTISEAVQKCFQINSVTNVLNRVREVIKLFKVSPIALKTFQDMQKMLCASPATENSLILDTSGRWNSTYDMLERVLEQHSTICAALLSGQARGDKDMMLSGNEITLVTDIIKTLKPLKLATTIMCEEKQPTASSILPIMYQLTEVELCHDDSDTELVTEMKSTIVSVLQNCYSKEPLQKLLSLATVIDPRFKSLSFMTGERRGRVYDILLAEGCEVGTVDTESKKDGSKTQTIISEPGQAKQSLSPGTISSVTTQTMVEFTSGDTESEPLMKKIKVEPGLDMGCSQGMESGEPVPEVPINIHVKVDQTTTVTEKAGLSMFLSDAAFQKKGTGQMPSSSSELVKYEIDRYQQKEDLSVQGDMLWWWSVRAPCSPMLAKLAMKYLAIPLTAISASRIFSDAGDRIISQRSLIEPCVLDTMIFLNKNLQ